MRVPATPEMVRHSLLRGPCRLRIQTSALWAWHVPMLVMTDAVAWARLARRTRFGALGSLAVFCVSAALTGARSLAPCAMTSR